MALTSKSGLAVVIGAIAALGVAAPASADIAWTWNNNDDRDSKAKFVSYGEHVYAYEYEGTDYVDYAYGPNEGLRWYIPGKEDKTQKDLNLDIKEGLVFQMEVCEDKNLAPDDCSDWKSSYS